MALGATLFLLSSKHHTRFMDSKYYRNALLGSLLTSDSTLDMGYVEVWDNLH